MNGVIRSDGQTASSFPGAGSGGAIVLNAATLSGTGSISANGGNDTSGYGGGGGGGGRVAILADTGGLSVNTVSAGPGTGGADGAAGTIFTSTRGGANPILIVDSGSATLATLTTPLESVPSGTELRIRSGANVANSASALPGLGVLNVSSHALLSLTVGANTFGGVSVDNATLSLSSAASTPLTMPSLTLTNAGVLTTASVSTPAHTGLTLSVAETVSVDATSSIDVTGAGCLSQKRWDPVAGACTTTGAATNWGGGSYAGPGAIPNSSTTNATYGNAATPSEPGSGGFNASGGGYVNLTATSLTLNGALKANGQNAASFPGAGSGGAIYLSVASLTGNGTISAGGGNDVSGYGGGGGGGGRVAVLADTSSLAISSVSSVQGTGGALGGAGTTFFSTRAGINPLVIVDAGQASLIPLTTPLESVPSGSEIRVKGGARVTNSVALPALGNVSVSGQGYLGLAVGNNQLGAVSVDAAKLALASAAGTPLTMPSLSLTNAGVLTSDTVAPPAHRGLYLSVSSVVTIDGSSSIDVTGAGCAAQRKWDTGSNTCIAAGAASGWSGGSYGGAGASVNSGTANATYGTSTTPAEPGSGGVNSAGGGSEPERRQPLAQRNHQGQWCKRHRFPGAGSGGGIIVTVDHALGRGQLLRQRWQ